MNDITQLLYLWLSNDEELYEDIQNRAGNPKDLENLVAEGLNYDSLTITWEGILDDILQLVQWNKLFNELVDY